MSAENIHAIFVDGGLVEQRDAPARPVARTNPKPNSAQGLTEPPARLERRVRRCGAITETGEPCPTWTLAERCQRHR